jgi:hypothetical protein
MLIQQLREIDPPPKHNILGAFKQTTLLTLSCISSRLVNPLKVDDASLQSSDILGLSVSFIFINFIFQKFFPFVPAMPTIFTYFTSKLSTLIWFRSCKHCILDCFLWSGSREHSSSNYYLCCFSSYRNRFSLAKVLILPWKFSQPYFYPCYHLCSPKLQIFLRS